MNSSAYENLLRTLECPVCTNYMIPPIKQCLTGHSFCGRCHEQLSGMQGAKCPLCQEKLTQSRNITLESIAETANYPCVNKDAGCNKTLPCQDMGKHQSECFFRETKCGMESCPKMIPLKDVESHWTSKKLTSKPFQVNNICHSKIKPTTFFVNLVKAHNALFWYKCKIVDNNIYFITQYVGPRFKAQNYYYEVELFKPDRPKRRLVISDYCKGPDMEHNKLFTPDNCVHLSLKAVEQFVGKDQVLIYYMRVMPVDSQETKKVHPGTKVLQKKASDPDCAGDKKKTRGKKPVANKSED